MEAYYSRLNAIRKAPYTVTVRRWDKCASEVPQRPSTD